MRGHNFIVHIDNGTGPQLHCFLTRIEVEAANEAEAEDAAIGLLRRTQKLRDMTRNSRDNPPRMFVERMGEYQSGSVPPLTVEPSLIWFPEDGSDGEAPDAKPNAAPDPAT